MSGIPWQLLRVISCSAKLVIPCLIKGKEAVSWEVKMVHFMTSVLEVFHKIILPLLDVINPLCLDVPPVPPDPSPALDGDSAPTCSTQQPKPLGLPKAHSV